MKRDKFWVDLQWHSDPAEDVTGVEEPQPSIGFTSYEEDIEILSPEEVAAKEAAAGGDEKTREELLAELEELRAKAAGPGPEVGELQQQLADVRRQQQGGLTVEQLQAFAQLQGLGQPQQKQETEAEFRERMKEHLLDDPASILDEYMAKKLTPEIKRLATNNLYHSQKYLELDPEKGTTYRKYKAEVDQAVQQLPNEMKLYDPQVYQKAYQQVMALHIDDIINEKVQEALKAQGGGGNGNPLVSRPRSHSEVGGMPNPVGPTAKKVVVASQKERDRAALRGVSAQQLAQWKLRHPGQEYGV